MMDAFSESVDSTDWLDQCLESSRPAMADVTEQDRSTIPCSGSGDETDDKVENLHRNRGGSKPHSTPLTLKWLEENYEIAEGVCIPRSTLYYHYLDFCQANDTQPVNAASFGKIIRQQFPQITTRRLGTRGQSKYHYYGIGVRETSSYYDIIYSAKGVQSVGDGKKENTKQMVAYSPRSKLGTLLPEFPNIKDVKIPAGVEEGKVLTFLMMYRTHCQRILDTVIRANFDEVQNFLLHFWQGMPPHIVPILDSPTIVMLVGVCDSILYRAIAAVLMPTVLQALPDSLTQVIRRFAKQLDEWLKTALSSLPQGLQNIKFDLARRFAQVLRRQTSLNHLCQAARSVLQSSEVTAQLLDDWLTVDLNSIVKQTLYTMDQYSDRDHSLIVSLCSEFERLLEEQAPIESYIEWLDIMVDRCVVKPSSSRPRSLRRIARQFLLMWSCFGTRVIRDMTLHSAPSFGSFHLLHLMFDDYVLYRIEALHSQERALEFMRIVRGEDLPGDPSDDLILPDPSALKENLQPMTSLSGPPGLVCQDRISVITSNRSILPDLQDYDSPQDGYTTDESSSLDQMPSPRGLGDSLRRSSTLTPPAAQHPNNMAVYAAGPSSHYSSQFKNMASGMNSGSHAHPFSNIEGAINGPVHQTLGASMEDQGGAHLMMHNNGRVTGTEWHTSQPTQRPHSMLGDSSAMLRGNEALTYSNYTPTIRHSGYDVSNYQYDVNTSSHKLTSMTEQAYVYQGYNEMSDVFMTSPALGPDQNKRRFEGDQSARSGKRHPRDMFYYEPTFTNI
ncbi:transcription factor RFX4-like [Pomacea canaliculata]|uniref:transcription factor RFX4-like n=1 Tax=Pomacea canaliculata TaxID=400727 RepID=UPI000D7310F4|nr:transcription factor RFX4-like [Pomacea canaliculata]